MKNLQEVSVITLMVFIRNVVTDSEIFLRTSGPDHIVDDKFLTPFFYTFTAESVLACYLRCVNLPHNCISVSFEKSSKNCTLTEDVSASTVPEMGWVSVILSDKILTTTTPVLTTTLIDCPTNFTRYLDKCYMVWNGTQETWYNAKTRCDEFSAELVSIETYDEQDFIGSLISGLDFDSHLWTSGQGMGVASKYQWKSSNVDVYYAEWADGFPNGNYGTDRCIYIDGYYLVWETQSCKYGINKFICEYPKSA